MRIAALLSLPAVLAAPTSERVPAAFAKDGFTVVRTASINGQTGYAAENRNVTTLATGRPKLAYYAEGSAYEMGWLLGKVSAHETAAICTEYLLHAVPSLLAWKFDKEHQNSTVYKIVAGLLERMVVAESSECFKREVARGAVPQYFEDEINGIVDGAKSELGHSSPVTFNKLATVAIGLDYLVGHVLAGNFSGLFARSRHSVLSEEERAFLDKHWDVRDVRPAAACDAFAARGKATKTGSGSIFARDFQFATGLVFQDYAAVTIYVPNDGRSPLAAAAAPGFVGAMTAMNQHGVAMGVDTLRTATVNASYPGLNAIMLVRHAISHAETSRDVVDIVAAAQRGVPYLYPLSDASGDGIVIEAGKFEEGSVAPDTLKYLEKDFILRALLPSAAQLAEWSKPDYRNGTYVRDMSYELPSEFFKFNERLFKRAGLEYDASRWEGLGSVFDNFTVENKDWLRLAQRYFSPQRRFSDDVLLVANYAIVPQLRVASMSLYSELIPGEASQWRYDTLARTVAGKVGSIDLDVARDVIDFLTPEKAPGYWADLYNASDPKTAIIEGSMVAADLQAKVFSSKYGYFPDGWVTITLPRYLS